MSLVKLRKHKTDSASFFGILGCFFLIVAGIVNYHLKKPGLKLSKQETAINFDKNLLIFSSAGNRRLFTDLIWVQTLIESDTDHHKKNDLNNWLYLRFNTIASLDPKFYENYLFGGQYLAIIKDDLEGAQDIYEKGIKVYPDDYSLNFHAGFLNYFEKGDYNKGLYYLNKISNHPRAPKYIKSIIHKIMASTGANLEEIFELVLHHYENTKDNHLKRRLRSDLYAIKSEIDLTCLNNKLSNCSTKDLNGDSYLFKNGEYESKIPFTKYRINKKN